MTLAFTGLTTFLPAMASAMVPLELNSCETITTPELAITGFDAMTLTAWRPPTWVEDPGTAMATCNDQITSSFHITARSLYRAMKAEGYSNDDIVSLASSLIGMVTKDLRFSKN